MKKHFVFLMLILFGCKSAENSGSELPVVFMKKTACMGACPDYDISIFSSGKVILNARKFLPLEGSFEARLPEARLDELLSLFVENRFMELESQYTSSRKDLPTTTVSFYNGGKKKTVIDYDGAPERLKAIEASIHNLIDSLSWSAVK
ncbi:MULTISPECIES: DUF6438 domain-containing protein [Roseivirga]|uniref:DUF6438 domain-containing protein n=1 Tax=Roseivirga TaxID=290180 RepID=UPI00257C0286|nr:MULTISPECIES: DUF6438 domain-containing protein [Roseivirga]|tara:strand:- start:6511 stop:6954 length:444 start_codon:yes stop_codon:yes gene_type:complete